MGGSIYGGETGLAISLPGGGVLAIPGAVVGGIGGGLIGAGTGLLTPDPAGSLGGYGSGSPIQFPFIYNQTPTGLLNDPDTTGIERKKRLTNCKRPGGVKGAKKDFDDLNPNNTQPITTPWGPGESGELPGGGTASWRPGSTGGDPTLQINQPGQTPVKIRYF